MDAPTFGYWLRRRRKSLDWTQTELAQRVHCTAAMIRKIEADERKPSRPLAEALAEQLKIPVDQRAAFLKAARHTTLSQDVTFNTPMSIAASSPNNLSAPLTSLIDRVNDIAAIAAMLTSDHVRLLTLIGPPGIGKTRLCIQSAENVLAHFSDGVWFVDLAPLAQHQLVLPTIARALNIAESGAMSPFQQLVTLLKDKRVLLALDNFEQVIDAARDVSELLKSCKGLKVLATSRVPLHVYGEHEYSVPGMSLPPRDTVPNKLIDYEAVQLFIARVREHQPRFMINDENAPHIAQVCNRLDGVPLALELAAASLRRMTIEKLAASFSDELNWLASFHTPAHDLPPRQRTLYNAIAWSYTLLDAPTQSVFRQLGVLVGGFDVESATAICAMDIHQIESALARLTDHSLLVLAPEQWRMLEMIREFALEQMDADERALVEQRHAIHFAARLNAISSNAENFALLAEHDHDNFRAALRWAILKRDGLLALTMCNKLADFWETQGYLREGLTWAREVNAISEKVEPSLRIAFLSSAGHLAWNRHEFDTALALTEQGIVLARVNGLERAEVAQFNILARIFIEQGDYARAEQTLRECVRLAEQYGEPNNLARAITQLGEVALACGRLDEAESFSKQSIALAANQIDRFVAMAHTNLAEIALARRNHTTAREELQHALPHIHTHIRRELCFLATLAGWLVTAPQATKETVQRGVEFFGAVERFIERTGAPLSAMYQNQSDERTKLAMKRLTPHEYQTAWNTGRAWSSETRNERAQSILQSETHL